MTDHNHALNRTLAHLNKAGHLPVTDAVELVHAVREEGRAMAWDSAEARQVTADAQSWNYLRTALLKLIDDPFIWDDGASEAEVFASWARRLAERASGPQLDSETTQPMATLPAVLTDVMASAPHRPCGGNSGRAHEPHLHDRAGQSYFCPGTASAAIPGQREESEPDAGDTA